MPRVRKPASPLRYLNSSPDVIQLVILMYVRFPLSLRDVEDLLFTRGIDICRETSLSRFCRVAGALELGARSKT